MAVSTVADLSRLSLDEIASIIESRSLPPVGQWQPERTGQIDIRIARDGRWFHEGSEIRRPALVRLFSTILRREDDGSYVLVTPAEKLAIKVEDVPFVAVEMKHAPGVGEATETAFRLNTGDLVLAGPDHPIALRDGPDGRLPYLHVRGGLWAKLARPVYYELMEIALANSPAGVESGGEFFALEDKA